MTKLFISYSIKDGNFTIKVMKYLAARASIFIYVNEENSNKTLAYKSKELEGYL
ncbi:hypothetical protein [Bacillus nitratireducens]|uniref:hypothetical protein n=1 Tax=Bacillus nitratireducens TaxID=2026193 RepID=UPI0015D4B32F|nr:hypothetical protein [Bacillus nitratireducens]